MLLDLDDETLRKIFRMQPPLTVGDLQRDEGPPEKNGNRRRDRREAAVGRPPQMKKEDQRHNGGRGPGVDPPEDKGKLASKVTVDDRQCKEQLGLNQ
jgi:hypothetical protein